MDSYIHLKNNPNINSQNNNSFVNNLNNQKNSSELLLPNINENKRIFIHKPSDFVKNKYTILGNLANNSEISYKGSRKCYHSPKFSMKDINQQKYRENKIIDSILKDEIHSLPSLLKSYIPGYNNLKDNNNINNENSKHLANESESANSLNNIMLKKYHRNSSHKEKKNNNSFAEQIAQRSENLVNLNFLVSSVKRRKPNYISNMKNYINYNQLANGNYLRDDSFDPRSYNRNYNFASVDYTSMNGM